MVQTTSQFAVIDYFYDLLVAGRAVGGSALVNVQISRFQVDPDKALSKCWVEMWGTEMETEFSAISNLGQTEEYTLEARIVVTMTGGTDAEQEAAYERAEAILAQVETIVRNNTGMGDNIDWCRISRVEVVPLLTLENLVVLVPFTLRCKAQLRFS